MSFLLGLGAGLLALLPFECSRRPPPCPDLIPVVVVERAMPVGAVLTWDDVSQRSLPAHDVFSSNITSDTANVVVGRRLAFPLSAGEPLRWSDLAPHGEGLRAGVQQLAIDVDSRRAVDGTLGAGDYVDVLVSTRDPQTNEAVVRTLLQDVEVAAVTHRPSPSLDTVTLLVTAEESALLTLGQDVGHYALTLRNPRDDRTIDPEITGINRLLGSNTVRIVCAHKRKQIEPILRDGR